MSVAGTAEGGIGVQDIVADLRAKVVELSEGKLQEDAVDPSRNLLDHGYVDSLSAVMLLAHIEDHWGVTVEDTEVLEGLDTLDAIARRVHEGSGGR